MALVGDRYRITEIAREFKARNLGGPDTLLRCLQDGLLEAYIEFPSFLPESTPIPTEVWSELNDEDLLPAFPRRGREDEVEQITIDAEFASDDELTALATVARAVAHRDVSIIDVRYHKHLCETKIVIEDMSPEQWEMVIKRFSEWRGQIAKDVSREFEVFVSRQSWTHFLVSEGVEAGVERAKPGRKPFPHWDEIIAEALVRLMAGEPIKSRKAFSESLAKWARAKFPNLSTNAIPTWDTIDGKIEELEQRAGRKFG